MSTQKIEVVNNDPMSSEKDIARVFTAAIQESISQVLINIERTDVTVNLSNIEYQLERVIRIYVQKTVDNSAKVACINFAGHIIDTNEKGKENLESIFQKYFYG